MALSKGGNFSSFTCDWRVLGGALSQIVLIEKKESKRGNGSNGLNFPQSGNWSGN